MALEDAIQENPNFEIVAGFLIDRPAKVVFKDKNIEVKWPKFVIYTDDHYFDIFQYQFIAGSKTGALTNPNTVVLTEDRAQQYFPNLLPQNIIGKKTLVTHFGSSPAAHAKLTLSITFLSLAT